MAEGQRMTAARGAVEEIMRSEHADVLRKSVALVVGELMEVEQLGHVEAASTRPAQATRPHHRLHTLSLDG